MVRSGILAVATATLMTLACDSGSDGSASGDPTGPDENNSAATPPVNLALPVPAAALLEGAIVNPFGVVRSSLDLVEFGHSGTDLVSARGTPIHAVDDGVIVTVETATDGFPGDLVRLLLSPNAPEGEGWVFLYEHISLLEGLGVGSTVARGDQIATNPLEIGRSNHLELACVFNNFLFHRDQRCWVFDLEPTERSALEERFNNVIRVHADFAGVWSQVDFNEGMLPLQGAAQHRHVSRWSAVVLPTWDGGAGSRRGDERSQVGGTSPFDTQLHPEELTVGVEPTTCCLQGSCSTN